jgi:hypothetical protein
MSPDRSGKLADEFVQIERPIVGRQRRDALTGS